MKLARKLIALALCAALTLGLAPAVNAAGNIRVTLPRFAVTLGGQTIDPAKEEYPFLVYKDITYLPLTYFGCRLLGLYEKWTEENGLVISDAGAKGQYESTPRRSGNSGVLYAQKAAGKITLCGTSIDNDREEYPFLLFRDITYLPMTWVNMHDRLGCTYTFDSQKGLVIDRAQSADSTALYLPIYRDTEGEAIGSITAWQGWFWYQDSEGWISRSPMAGGEREKLFEVPENPLFDPARAALAGLWVRDGRLYMKYHLGGATMGHDELYRFNADGSVVPLVKANGPVGEFDGMWLHANCSLMPSPGNLNVSRDGGKTWESFGSEEYIYGCSYHSTKRGGATGSSGTGGDISRVGDGAYLLAAHVPDWGRAQPDANGDYPEVFSAVCRVDLATGETKEITGPATSFEIAGETIWYLDFNGALHRCALDGSNDAAVVTPSGEATVKMFCADANGAYAFLTDERLVGGMGVEVHFATKTYLAVVSASGETEQLDLNAFSVYSMQMENGWLTMLLENDTTDETGLLVCRNGTKVYENYGPDYLAAGVSNGKLYYVLK